MKILFLFIAFFLLIIPTSGAIFINEIMPDPADNSSDRSEWLEITTDFNESLENITIDTGETPIKLNGSIQSGEFIIITKNSSVFLDIWNTSVRILGNNKMSLRNDGDNITIYNSSEILDSIEYNDSKSNISYGLCNFSFIEQTMPTPGFPNTCIFDENNETTNETANDTCDISLGILSDLVFIPGETQNYNLELIDSECDQKEKDVKIEYWIEDMFGGIVKPPYITTKNITCEKNISRQWTPDDIIGSEGYYIKAFIRESGCNDSYELNNNAEKLIIVKGKTNSEPECECPSPDQTPCSCGPCPSCVDKDEDSKEEFEIISFPNEIFWDEEILIKLKIKNTDSYERNYTVYSYIYDSNKLLSSGFTGESWLKEWDANKMDVNVASDSSLTLDLKNKVSNEAEPGEYKLRVRIWSGGKKHDITEDIVIKESLTDEQQDFEETLDYESEESEQQAVSESRIPTGNIVLENEGDWLGLIVENIINFFKNLFNL